jgi:hypothetical protein
VTSITLGDQCQDTIVVYTSKAAHVSPPTKHVLSGDTGGSVGDVTRVGLFARGTESSYKTMQLKSKHWEENGRRAAFLSFEPTAF